MIKASTYRGEEVAVFGLGRSGITTALSLQSGGATVYAWDDNQDARKFAKSQGVHIRDLRKIDWSKISALALSPGVPDTLPEPHWSAKLAKSADVPIIGDIEIFAREVMARAPERRPKIIAITGTNGKSTTTALIGHILQDCGRDAQVGGNIGRGVLDLDDMHAGAVYVIELSSYQLERTYSLKANAAVFLNLSSDHLVRHGDMEGYKRAKLRIFNNQDKTDTAVIGVDDPHVKAICSKLIARNNRKIAPISGRRSMGRGACVIKGVLYALINKKCEKIADLNHAPNLVGEHNWQNAAAAFAAVHALGLDARKIGQALLSFPGLAHRMENIGKVGPVLFVNDSKATNVDAAAQALKAYDNIYWIAGGQADKGGIEDLQKFFPHISRAYLIGEAAMGFATTLREAKVPCKISKELRLAIMCATKDALNSRSKNPVILLSPACASFDQFKSFEARGDDFRTLAEEIISIFEREKQNMQTGAGAA
ncbi:MAG TPA: UDP-N-acetylmuramoyl-L-alanine--D-glutamate ligase [Hellea balneolensis]|uniref:UDP-N-acetylmuramoylalanine--D-glutamate ligase n=1 Tax=Hellea balneolensis TaxID=287478 RepID=A0A7C5LS66_9PROT|nr:UDP-N-acetylmuramoyl-L-alanine--D-glutamate ligase [Hellea balneolensis]